MNRRSRQITIFFLFLITIALAGVSAYIAFTLQDDTASEDSSAAVSCEADCPGEDLTDKPEGTFGCRDETRCTEGKGGPGCFLYTAGDYCYTTCEKKDGGWSNWGSCNSNCKQTRTCTNPSPSCGGSNCEGDSQKACTGGACVSCGDGVCSATENATSCPDDCTKCGDGICSETENATSCPNDCADCGDGICSTTESVESCPDDCAECGDGVCSPNENEATCPQDCSKCGDDICSSNETAANCPEDCANCGDGICSSTENVANCERDCAKCGDGVCSKSEDGLSCPLDCNSECSDRIDNDSDGKIDRNDPECFDERGVYDPHRQEYYEIPVTAVINEQTYLLYGIVLVAVSIFMYEMRVFSFATQLLTRTRIRFIFAPFDETVNQELQQKKLEKEQKTASKNRTKNREQFEKRFAK